MMDRGATAAAQNLWFFEVAWEVANKGIYRCSEPVHITSKYNFITYKGINMINKVAGCNLPLH